MVDEQPQFAASRGRDGLVLIANDHEWTARSIETILVANGLRVVRTFTGHETLAAAARELPDLFILDHQLPDISGVAVCAALRADPRFGASAPIMITTAGPSGRQQRLAAYEAIRSSADRSTLRRPRNVLTVTGKNVTYAAIIARARPSSFSTL